MKHYLPIVFFLGTVTTLFLSLPEPATAACWECKDLNSTPHCLVTTTTGHTTCTVTSTTVGGIEIEECEESGASCQSDVNNGGNHGNMPPVDGCEVHLTPQIPNPTTTPHGAPAPWEPRRPAAEPDAGEDSPQSSDAARA